jgi:hypothetical protein
MGGGVAFKAITKVFKGIYTGDGFMTLDFKDNHPQVCSLQLSVEIVTLFRRSFCCFQIDFPKISAIEIVPEGQVLPITLAPNALKTPVAATKAPALATKAPTKAPSKAPTRSPTKSPTKAPTKNPTKAPVAPTKAPILPPVSAPKAAPVLAPAAPAFNPVLINCGGAAYGE